MTQGTQRLNIAKWENGKTMVVCVDVKFVVRYTNDHPYHRNVYSYSEAEWDELMDHLRDMPWLDIFKHDTTYAYIVKWENWKTKFFFRRAIRISTCRINEKQGS